MDGGSAARAGDRGGDRIPTLRASRLRVATAALAFVVAVALAASLLAGTESSAPALVPLAAAALVAVVLSLVWTPLTGIVLVVLATEFVLRELDARLAAPQTAAFGAGLLLVGELLAWSDSLRGSARVAPGVVARRAGNLAAIVLLGAGAAALTVEAGRIDSPNAFVAGVAGAAAVAAVLGVVWSLGRSR
jgi:hypothetical protein